MGRKLILTEGEFFDKGRPRFRRNGKIVFTNGCFDLFHPGHLTLIKHARALGDYLIVGLNSDQSVHMLKGESRPIVNQWGRARILNELRSVDSVVIFDDLIRLIEAVRPDVLVKGSDWQDKKVEGSEYATHVEFVPLFGDYSTTRLAAFV